MSVSKDYGAYHLADPVYGAVGLSKLEWQVINTPVFQRLRRVKHLGLVHLVYPSADFPRFTHCVGTCHVAGRILNSPSMPRIAMRDHALHRLVALLHDIGHYPFSHTLEHAARHHYGTEAGSGALTHEALGEVVVRDDKELRKVLGRGRVDDVCGLLHGETRLGRTWIRELVSSDLDCDRIDYLLRTACFAGLPYGHVDIDYLMQHFAYNEDDGLHLKRRALRAADHLLLCRFFDRQQVAFNEQVVAYELLLHDVVRALLTHGMVDLSAASVSTMVRGGQWQRFDDETVIRAIRTLAEDTASAAGDKARALLDRRRRPVRVAEVEFLGSRLQCGGKFRNHETNLRALVSRYATKHGIPEDYWLVWKPDECPITAEGHVYAPAGRLGEADSHEDSLVRVEDPTDGRVKPIISIERALMSRLCDDLLCHFRVYVLLPDGIPRAVGDTISAEMQSEVERWR